MAGARRSATFVNGRRPQRTVGRGGCHCGVCSLCVGKKRAVVDVIIMGPVDESSGRAVTVGHRFPKGCETANPPACVGIGGMALIAEVCGCEAILRLGCVKIDRVSVAFPTAQTGIGRLEAIREEFSVTSPLRPCGTVYIFVGDAKSVALFATGLSQDTVIVGAVAFRTGGSCPCPDAVDEAVPVKAVVPL